MRRRVVVAFLTAVFVLSLVAQDKKQLEEALTPEAMKAFQERRSKLFQWESYRFLMGNWKTEAAAAGAAGAAFAVTRSLDGKVLMISNGHPLFKAAGATKRTGAYKSLTIIYLEGLTPRATFYDNEGRVQTFDVEANGSRLTLLGDAVANTPRARITYEESRAGAINIAVEAAPVRSTKFAPQTKIGAVRVSQ